MNHKEIVKYPFRTNRHTVLKAATGAAAASRRSLGTAVCSGMITSTVLAVFFTPVFYYVIRWLTAGKT